jgi:uncharacterized membrane protein YfcA
MTIVIGFVIAVVLGLTGMGGGTFTTPALVLLVGLPAGEAVGTTMVFAAVLRLLAAPVYFFRQQVHGRYVLILLAGAVPGLLIGTWLLHRMRGSLYTPAVLLAIGGMLALSSAITFIPKLRAPHFARERRGWLSVIAFPIGIETGFSSAGAGALGSILLLNFSELAPAQVVGTDLLFGIVLAVIGSALHLGWGSIDRATLVQLLWGGVPGVMLGCLLSKAFSGKRLRVAVAVVGIVLGLQLVWSGGRSFVEQHRNSTLEAKTNPAR